MGAGELLAWLAAGVAIAAAAMAFRQARAASRAAEQAKAWAAQSGHPSVLDGRQALASGEQDRLMTRAQVLRNLIVAVEQAMTATVRLVEEARIPGADTAKALEQFLLKREALEAMRGALGPELKTVVQHLLWEMELAARATVAREALPPARLPNGEHNDEAPEMRVASLASALLGSARARLEEASTRMAGNDR